MAASQPGLQVRTHAGSRAIGQRCQLPRARGHVVLWQRNAGPGADRASQHRLDRAVEWHRPGSRPLLELTLPFVSSALDQLLHARRSGQRHEEGFARAMPRAVQPLHPALAEQRRPQQLRCRTLALEALRIVEECSGMFAAHAQRVLKQERGFEHIGAQAFAVVADEAIRIGEQRQAAVPLPESWRGSRKDGCSHGGATLVIAAVASGVPMGSRFRRPVACLRGSF
jgi:hypothetical protein